MNFRFPLATSSWGKEEVEAMLRVISDGHFTMGEHVRRFEEDFSRYVGSRHAVMVNSGSSAVLLMVSALRYTKNPKYRLKPGDEVIVPAVSWSTTYYPLYQYGLKLKFVDIDLMTLNYDLSALKDAVDGNTRAIMAVNLLGNPNDFPAIFEIIGDKNILVIEDNCESMGAKIAGRQTGTFGVMGAFSTFFSHHISTMEGGVIVTDDDELHHILLCLRAHGWTRNLPKFNLVCGQKSDNSFEESFRFVLPGYNVRPLELEGALGVQQVGRLPHIVSERRLNGRYLQEKLANHPDLIIQKELGESSWFGFSLVVRPGSSLSRKVLLERLHFNGFEVRPIVAGNFAKNEVVQLFNYEIHGELKNAEYIDANGVFIGNHHYPIRDAIDVLGAL